MFFLPRAQYEVRVLPQMEQRGGGEEEEGDESAADFADRVQEATAAVLRVVPSVWANSDKNRFARKHWVSAPYWLSCCTAPNTVGP